MSDFLDSVLGQGASETSVVQPLFPSRFEAPRAQASPTFSERDAAGVVAEPGLGPADSNWGVRPPRGPSAATSIQPSQPLLAPLVDRAGRHSNDEFASDASAIEPPARVLEGPSIAPLLRPPVRGAGESRDDAGLTRVERQPLPFAPTDASPVLPRLTSDLETTSRQAPTRDEWLWQRMEELTAEIRRLQGAAARRPDHQAHVPELAMPAARPAWRTDAESGEPDIARAGDSPDPARPRIIPEKPAVGVSQSAAPTVNVTIGRVEVRAVREGSIKAPRHTRAKTPVMTLDQYLQRRSAGGAR